MGAAPEWEGASSITGAIQILFSSLLFSSLHKRLLTQDRTTGNIVVLTLVAGAVYGYLQYQKKQGNTVKVGNKKLN